MTHIKHALLAIAALAVTFFLSGSALGHSVGQVQTAKRISPTTVTLLDPQGNPVPGGMGTDTKAKVGDVLSFIIQFTPVPNNATRGAGGYITEYVPPNTRVVGARIIDKNFNTVRPKRGALMTDGWGPRGRKNQFDAMGLGQGSLSAVYADTGIFFSTDPRTTRVPNNQFITVFNGIVMNPAPTGAGGLGTLLGTPGPYYGHNLWDVDQAYAFGVNGAYVSNGNGTVPFMYGSAVAGPQTHYRYEIVPGGSTGPSCSDAMDNDADMLSDYPNDPGCASSLDDDETTATDGPVGPWQRIRHTGSEIGTGGVTNCQNCAPEYVRVGVPTALGWDLNFDNPLPPTANAVRYAVGELIVGQEYFAEISLEVTGLPLDPNMMGDVNCSEVFGGDAAMPQNGQDNTWRYFVPAPSCVSLNLKFDLSVDKLLAVPGDTLTYKIEGKNLSVNPQTNVVVTDTFVAGDVSFLGVLQGPPPTVGNGLLTWPTIATLAPGATFTYEWQMTVTGNNLSTLNRARYVSTQLPAPGFSVVALTTIEAIVVLEQNVVVTPTSTTPGSAVNYVATITNSGTGAATLNGASFVEFTLPTGFSFCGTGGGCTQPLINMVGVADPTPGPNNTIVFTTGLQTIPPNGGTMTVDFDVRVGMAVPPGKYTLDMQTTLRDNGIGRDVEISSFGVAPLLVSAVQSVPPVLDSPVLAGAMAVTGVTSEGQGTTITVFVNGNSVPNVVAGPGGIFSAVVPTLFAGQHLNATATAVNELESNLSSPDVIVQGIGGITFCNDGLDNDGDTLIDFPNDPGCTSPWDPDETDIPECSDGLDNDADTLIDFPNDPSCSSYLDDDESGPPACGDTADNDGDMLIDFPSDPGCDSATDINEQDIAACANGQDDDADGLVDYPNDPGCTDPYDDVEDDMGGVGGAGGGTAAGGMGPGTGSGGIGNGTPPDLGGFTEDQVTGGDDSGCGCRVAGDGPRQLAPWLMLMAASVALGARRRAGSSRARRHRA